MSERDRDLLKGLDSDPATCNSLYCNAIQQLFTSSRQQLTTPLAQPDQKFVSLADAGAQPGWITLAFQNDDSCTDDPVSVEVWRAQCPQTPGRISGLVPTCPFNEKQVLQHSADGGGLPKNLIYQWQWAETQDGPWNDYNPPTEFLDGRGLREVLIGGASPFTLADSWWRARYRGYGGCPCPASTPCQAACVDGECSQGSNAGLSCTTDADCPYDCCPNAGKGEEDWFSSLDWNEANPTQVSAWTGPMLAEGWIKRVIRGLNPFDQRIGDFHINPATTYVSMISQAGIRFEAPVALNCTPENLNNLGLIEIYETALRRARQFSIDVGISFDPANLAILLVSSKIADLYTLLGNEAFADAADPTIGLFDQAAEPQFPSSFFCFQGQRANLLEEELALLRGRSESQPITPDPVTGEIIATVYNRLPWNFTLSDGAVAYANNYQVVNVEQALNLYPQGHGDAWGHYLTAMKKFYRLLRHPVFEWIVSTEAVLVAGQPVAVGFQYERKFARAAAAKARTGAAITSLTFRQLYSADPAQQGDYPDTDHDRAWGVVQWGRRAAQGAYFDWVTVNALLDDDDDDPEHANTIKKIDRTTVTEIEEISRAFLEIQSTVNKAVSGLNPLGLATNVVPFGINPSQIEQGKTHFDQIYERALVSLNNAVIAFDFANDNSRRLRATQDQSDDFANLVADNERDFKGRLIEIFGRPYPQDIGGPAGTYQPGYDGPDIFHFEYVEPSALIGQDSSGTTTIDVTYTELTVDVDVDGNVTEDTITVRYNVSTDGLGLIKPQGWTTRLEPGEIQLARSELLQTTGRYLQALETYEIHLDKIDGELQTWKDLTQLNSDILGVRNTTLNTQIGLNVAILAARTAQIGFRIAGDTAVGLGEAVAEGFPESATTFGGDFTAPLRAVAKAAGVLLGTLAYVGAGIAEVTELGFEQLIANAQAQADIDIAGFEGTFAENQQLNMVQDLIRETPVLQLEILMQMEAIKQATGVYQSAIGRGVRLLEQRTAFRQQTAVQVSQYRYQDMAFRIFRNDALQKYRAQFDLAARYAFLTAKAYDYETNLLGSDTQAGREFLTDLTRERLLGRVDGGGQPIVGNGLADVLGRLKANFDVLRVQLGFNSPDQFERTFSLRWELFRIPNTPDFDPAWQDTLQGFRIDDLNTFQEYNQYCQPLQPPVTPNPAIVIPFSTTIQAGFNLFGKESMGDATLPSTFFSIKLHSYGARFADYPGAPLNVQVNVYLVPVGSDFMRVPTQGAPIRQWQLLDQTMPLPFSIVESDLLEPEWMPWDALSGGPQALVRRRLIPTTAAQDFIDDPLLDFCVEGEVPGDASFKLTGRSIWNSRWLLIIPGSELQGSNPDNGVDVFINRVSDIKLLTCSYGYSGTVAAAMNGSDDAAGPGEQVQPLVTPSETRFLGAVLATPFPVP
ncbi:MAG: hypothetical protein V3W34_01085 [Phycisphaerae bacterium]